MQNEENRMGKGLLIGILTGAAVGSIITLLFAPKSGKGLREDIKTKSQDFIENADDCIMKAKDKSSQLINGGKKKYEKLLTETKEKVDTLIGEAEKLLSKVKDKNKKVPHYEDKEKTIKR
jgi:gas vesicle protein